MVVAASPILTNIWIHTVHLHIKTSLKLGGLRLNLFCYQKKVKFNCLFLRNKIVGFSVTFDAQFLKYFEGYSTPLQGSSGEKNCTRTVFKETPQIIYHWNVEFDKLNI